jgi:carboxymethylenebutenolidase
MTRTTATGSAATPTSRSPRLRRLLLPLLLPALLLAGCAGTGSGPAGDGAGRPGPLVLPASAETAVPALVASPRHGEWLDIAVGDDTVRTWIVYPERADAAPVVLVIHEIYGLTDWIRAVCDRLAGEGYIAVAPDLLSGKGPDGGGTEAFNADTVRGAIRGLDADEITRRLDGVAAHVTAMPAARDAVACTGFCWGGSTTFMYATRQPDLAAAAVWYGTAPTDLAELARIRTPVIGFYGQDDARVTSTVEPTRAAMNAVDRAFTPRVYDGAGHGFLRQQDGRDGANLTAAGAAWAEFLVTLRAGFGEG